MKPLHIVSVVEGHGEVDALNTLIRRVASETHPSCSFRFPEPIRTSKTKLISKKGEVNRAEIERVMELAVGKMVQHGAILLLLDADYLCPFEMGPKILNSATEARSDIDIGVVLANTEYESWFVAAIESLSGKHGLKDNLKFQDASKNAGKNWIKNQMLLDKKYQETRSQLEMTRDFDMQLARSRSDSFDKFYREVTRLIDILTKGGETDA